MSRFKQLEGESGAVWKEPPGPEVPDLEGEEFEDTMVLDVADSLPLLETVFEALNIAVPWHEENEHLDVRSTQKLASRLKPLDWEAVAAKGVTLGGHEEDGGELWERFRAFVVDAARSCNAIEWELDED